MKEGRSIVMINKLLIQTHLNQLITLISDQQDFL